MAKTVNSATLLGNVGKEPDVKTTGGGTLVANFSVATTHRIKDSSGNWQDETTWHNVTAFGRTAEIVRDYLNKGSKVYLEGRIANESWEKDGVKHYRTKIIVNEIVLLSGKSESPSAPAYQSQTSAPTEIDADEIPF